ncbi:MAPEG family protein [Bosea sp. (in: a-proteobacteria)]|uniref:MAPEG family protein n=1 Tax=Bosea sp. (in: a-proteobacteria) TaxID=1871050 RepID=UPI0026133E28|nr:MAPEG family protein [Bosea sp. (in: a-proteobacteria)]MCO5093416.1 MAPEG family protein [Bosea sp. (in: a-proteobacteria)]
MTLKLIYPTLAMIFWIFVVGVVLMLRRKSAFGSGAVRLDEVAVSTESYPLPARLAGANFSNQFETPVIFFALVMIAMETGATGHAMVLLAWFYVATRIAHTLIHIGPNRLPLRGAAYGLGVLALFGMWLGVLLTVL